MTLETFPHLEALGKIPGVVDFLVTEVSTSEEKNFPLVEFIDTPGLTDGTLKYPFDVDNVIYELAEHATMIIGPIVATPVRAAATLSNPLTPIRGRRPPSPTP